ncbi:four helix bundle protein [Aequorivita ciconiae]|uniref:four helix bundle protein n=1 Tax=Aequorivita ciconiae TaxID=2494375 RepID=UPI001F0CC58B|nr:four helix bundle protein [Aequorivita sp. H23M31]
MSFIFEKLEIWKKAMEFGEDVDTIGDTFPKKEIFNHSSQIRRAADSIALNISEGCILPSNAEQKKFLGYSIPSGNLLF